MSLGVIIAPLAVLLVWGVSYFVSALNWISAPGRAMRIALATRGGPVTLRAASYAIDWRSGLIYATDVSLFDPYESPLASADRLYISLPAPFGRHSALEVKAQSPWFLVEREPDGHVRLFRYLPEKTAEPSRLPFQIELNSARFDVVDLAGKDVWFRRVLSDKVLIDGVGETYAASGKLVWQGGEAQATLRNDPDVGTSLEARLANTEAADVLRHLADAPEGQEATWLRDLSAKSLRANGRVVLRMPVKGNLKLDAEGSLSGRAVRYGKDYSADTGQFVGTITEQGAVGVLTAQNARSNARFEGSITLGEKAAVGGNLVLVSDRLSTLPDWMIKHLPKSLDAENPRYSGWLAYYPGKGLYLRGDFAATTATYSGETVTSPVGEIRMQRDAVAFDLKSSAWKNASASGLVSVDLKSRNLAGMVKGIRVPVSEFLSRWGVKDITGIAEGEAIISGTVEEPRATIRVKGKTWLVRRDKPPLYLGEFSTFANTVGQIAEIRRISLFGGPGTLIGNGRVDLQGRGISGDISVFGFDATVLNEELSGIGSAAFKVGGTIENPRATGRVEVYNGAFRGQSVPIALADIAVDRNKVHVDNLVAMRGAARGQGSLDYVFANGALSGNFEAEGVQLADIGGEAFVGSVKLLDGKIGGTASRPALTARVEGNDLAIQSVKVDSVSGVAKLEANVISADDIKLRSGEGEVVASLKYDIDTKTGQASGSATKLSLEKILPPLPSDTRIAGTIDGDFNLKLGPNGVTNGEAKGKVAELTINPTNLGSGSWDLKFEEGKWIASAELGQIERYLQLNSATYDPAQQTFSGQLVAYDLPLRDLYFAVRPYVVPGERAEKPPLELPSGLVNFLDRLEGNLDAAIATEGKFNDPTIRIESLDLRNLLLDGANAGSLNARAQRQNGEWGIDQFRWTNGAAILSATGTVVEDGLVVLTGDLKNVRTDWLAQFLPGLGALNGKGDLSFEVSGQARSPVMVASLDATFFEPPVQPEVIAGKGFGQPSELKPAFARDPRLRVSIAPIELRDGGLTAEGSFSWVGFKGNLTAKLPFRYPFEIPDDQQMEVVLDVPKRSIGELKDMWPQIDAEQTKGDVWAKVRLTGTRANAFVAGEIALQGEQLGLTSVDTRLKNLNFSAKLEGDSVNVALSAESSRGGSTEGSAHMALGNLGEALRTSWEALLSGSLEGQIALKDFRIRETHGDRGKADVTAVGTIHLGGTLGEPFLFTKEPIALNGFSARAPDVFEERASTIEGPVRPRFDLKYALAEAETPAELEIGAGNFKLYGDGALGGTIYAPTLSGNYTVLGGSIRLPNARIMIEEGGSARLLYSAEPEDPQTRLDVDLTGRTSITAASIAGVAQRYDIHLQLRGNILEPGQTQIYAQSDPPDLSQDRILALLGQRDLIESIAPAGLAVGSDLERRLGTAFSFALPLFLDPYTERLATDIGLEYLSLEYNPFEGPTVTAAKSLSRTMTVQYRRQLAEGPDGRLRFDFRITYRPFIARNVWRNLYFSAGADTERPWKLSVEYGFRF